MPVPTDRTDATDRTTVAERRSSARRRAGLSAMIMIGVLLVLGLVAAALRPAWQVDPIDFKLPSRSAKVPTMPQGQRSGQPTAAPRVTPPGHGPDLSWLRWVGLGLLIVAAAIVVALIASRILAVRRMYAERPDDELEVVGEITPDLPTLQQGAARAEERLLAVGNPTDAIIAAWLALEEAAEASGVPRQAAQTPTEFTADVLGRTGIDAEPVQTLLGLYLHARFSAQPASAADLDQARGCVRRLADGWQAFSEAPPRPSPDTPDGSGDAG